MDEWGVILGLIIGGAIGALWVRPFIRWLIWLDLRESYPEYRDSFSEYLKRVRALKL